MQGLVSVMIPCFNGESFVSKLFDSFLEQTYSKIHLILVDDGSTDNTREVVFSYVERFKKVGIELEYIWQENSGVSVAINTALKCVKGEFCMWIDSDDYVTPDHVERKVNALVENSKAAIVRCQGTCVGEDGNFLGLLGNEESVGTFYEDVMLGFKACTPGLYMVRTRVLLDSLVERSIYPHRQGQNLQLLGAVTYNKEIVCIQDRLFYYVVRKESSCHKIWDANKWKTYMDGVEDISFNTIGRMQKKMSPEYYHKFSEWIRLKSAITRMEGFYSYGIGELDTEYVEGVLVRWLGKDLEKDAREKYIWGADLKGKAVGDLLEKVFGIKISGYVDSNYAKIEGAQSPDVLNVQEHYVIVPLWVHQDILTKLEQKGYASKDFTYPCATLINDILNYNKCRKIVLSDMDKGGIK